MANIEHPTSNAERRMERGEAPFHYSALGVRCSAFDVLVFLLLFVVAPAICAQTNLPDLALASPFRGESSCSSSGCHGGAGEKHNQCLRWSKFDVHTRSYATLTLARSARIAEVLKLGDPVQSTRCTTCHAPFQTIATNAALQKILDPTSGVSCENCHGPAEKWLLSHTRADYSHQDRVNAGMRDLNNLYVRANTCVACHQNVDPDILKAGHPELIFELDGQAVSEPKHWQEVTNWSGPQTWYIGQAVAFREMSWQLSRLESPTENDTNRWFALAWMMQIVLFNKTLPYAEPAQARYMNGISRGDQIARAEALKKWPAGETRRCLKVLAATAPDFRDGATAKQEQARRAERLVLALDRLVAGLNDATLVKRLDVPLGKLFKDAQSLPDFEPKAFADDLDVFQKALEPK